jgi:large subunit ribosomal protein L18
MNLKQEQRKTRHTRVRAKVKGTGSCPRLCVFRSNKYIYSQIVDDSAGRVLFSERGKKAVKEAFGVGKNIAKSAQAKKIEKVVFDRGGYKYHGRVKALAEGAREGGLKF